jgi:hypothetical protein
MIRRLFTFARRRGWVRLAYTLECAACREFTTRRWPAARDHDCSSRGRAFRRRAARAARKGHALVVEPPP